MQTEPAPSYLAGGDDDRGCRSRPLAASAARRRRWPVALHVSFITVAAAAIGVALTVVAVTLAPNTAPIEPTPPSSTPREEPAGSDEISPTAESSVVTVLGRLDDHLGASNRDVDDRVSVAVRGDVLHVTWAVDEPSRGEPDQTTSNGRHLKQLRRELIVVLRALADGPLPLEVGHIRVRATYAASGEPEAVVLDALLRAEMATALEPDDVRLEDATLFELLGLAEIVTGDPAWGIPTQ